MYVKKYLDTINIIKGRVTFLFFVDLLQIIKIISVLCFTTKVSVNHKKVYNIECMYKCVQKYSCKFSTCKGKQETGKNC